MSKGQEWRVVGTNQNNGSQVLDPDGKALKGINRIEWEHRAGQPPVLHLTIVGAKLDAEPTQLGDVVVNVLCKECGARLEVMNVTDLDSKFVEWARVDLGT